MPKSDRLDRRGIEERSKEVKRERKRWWRDREWERKQVQSK